MASVLYLTGGTNGGIWRGKPDVTGQYLLKAEDSGSSQTILKFASDGTEGDTTFIVMAVGDQGEILKSERDGALEGTWSTVFTGDGSINSIVYGDGVWLAVGDAIVYRSEDDGTTWETITGYAIDNGNWLDVEYGNGQFVAVGSAYVQNKLIGAVMFSEDGGTAWTKGSAGLGQALQAVAYGEDINKFAAVGVSGGIVSVDA
jgi:photosystem II stability/assembly factor-like uncharacterized protein